MIAVNKTKGAIKSAYKKRKQVFITKVVKFYHPLGLASPLSLSRRICIEKGAILNADGINLYLNMSLSMETINGRESQPPALLFMHSAMRAKMEQPLPPIPSNCPTDQCA